VLQKKQQLAAAPQQLIINSKTMSKQSYLQVDTGPETFMGKRQRTEPNGAVEGGKKTAEDSDAEEKTTVVSPDEASQQGALGDLITPTSNTESVGEFFSSKKRLPPKNSENVMLADMIAKAENWLSLEWARLSEEQQLRLSFIMVRGYEEHLPTFFAVGSPFMELLNRQRLESPVQAVLESLKDETKCGKRLARLIYKGGDVRTKSICLFCSAYFVKQNKKLLILLNKIKNCFFVSNKIRRCLFG
jgi:hypothetical protein